MRSDLGYWKDKNQQSNVQKSWLVGQQWTTNTIFLFDFITKFADQYLILNKFTTSKFMVEKWIAVT